MESFINLAMILICVFLFVCFVDMVIKQLTKSKDYLKENRPDRKFFHITIITSLASFLLLFVPALKELFFLDYETDFPL